MKGLQEHPVVTAFGATTIIVLTLLAPLVSPLHHQLYHFCGPASALILPVLLNFAGVWIVLALLLAGGLQFRWLRPFAALRTRDVFDNLLTGRISTSQQLAGWAQQGN